MSEKSIYSFFKLLMALLCLLPVMSGFSANRYLVAGGNGNWNSSTNWSATSGGSSGASFPVAGDVVIIDTNSANANITVNVTSACASISINNNYTGTLLLDSNITTTSTVTLGSQMTLSGSGIWTMNNTCTITSAGKYFPALTLAGYQKNYTFSDTLRVSGQLRIITENSSTIGGGTVAALCGSLYLGGGQTLTITCNLISSNSTVIAGTITINSSGKSIYTSGVTVNANSTGSAAFRLIGGTWSGTNTLSNPLYFQGDCTVSGVVNYATSTIYYTSGAITTTGSTLQCNAGAGFSCAGITWNDVTIGGYNQYYGLWQDLNVGGKLKFNGTGSSTWSGAYTINCGSLDLMGIVVALSGNINVTGQTTVSGSSSLNGAYVLSTGGYTGNATLSGSFTKLVFNGKGTWSGSAVISYRTIEINTTDTLTVSGIINFLTANLIHISGTVLAGGSTLACTSYMYFKTAGMNWGNITLTVYNITHGLGSDLNLSGTLRLVTTSNTGFSGAYNINAGNLTLEGYGNVVVPAGLTVSGLTSVLGNTALNGSFTLYTGGLYSGATLGGTFSGIVFNSTGTWSGGTNITKPITINTTGTLTLSGVISTTGTFVRTAGTVIATGSTFTRSGTFDPNGITWGNITLNNTTTLTADCNMTGTLTVTAGSLNGAYKYYVGGGFSYTGGSSLGGTSSIVINGKGTIGVTNPAGAVSLPFTINTTDTITFGPNFRINGCQFTFTAGKIVSTGSTFETSGTASTISINNTGFRMGTYLSSISQAFGGSEGFSIGTFNCPTAGRTFTFRADKTYTIENEVSIVGTAASHCLWKSDTPGTKAIVTVNQGAIYDLGFCDATDINSSLGRTVLTYKGTRTNTDNWNLVPTVPKSGAFTFN